MRRSLFAGVSGLRNHQIRMDVIGNNISNVNTVAFKSGRVEFKEGFAQLLQGGSRPPGDQGGINPIQVGLGMQIGSVDTIFSQGNLETTGLNTDVAIQGNSFFIARKGNQSYYTRSGNFQVDAAGLLVSPTNGFVMQGKIATNGVFSDAVTDIKLPFGQKTSATATASMKLAGNLDASVSTFDTTDPDGAAGPAVAGFNAATRAVPANKNSWTETSITAYDSLGTKYDVKAYLWKTAANTWNWQVDPSSLTAAGVPAAGITGSGTFTFAADGTLSTGVRRRRHHAVRGDEHGGHARSERVHVGLAAEFQHRTRWNDYGFLHERRQCSARADRPRGLQQPGGSPAHRRQHVPRVEQLGRRRLRVRPRRKPVDAHERRAGNVERRSRPGIYVDDHRSAWIPGEQQGHHDERRNAAGVGEPQAVKPSGMQENDDS
jgi:flagellar hook-basal body protein